MHIIPKDEDNHPILLTKGGHMDVKCILGYNEASLKSNPIQVDFDLQGPPSSEQQFTHKITEMDASAEFLCYHQQYGHISLKCIQAMAKLGILPRHLATCPIPNCQAFLWEEHQETMEVQDLR